MAVGEPFKAHDGALEQGDIIANVPIARWKDGELAGTTPKLCVVTANECTCEDYERAVPRGSDAVARIWIHVAPLVNASTFPEEKQEELKRGQRYDKFYIHGDDKLADQVANLVQEQPVPGLVLAGLPKAARLADWQFKHLQIHCTVCRFHLKPEALFREELLKGGDSGA